MILKVWFKIFLIIFSVSVPLIWIQYLSQRESLEIAFEVAEKITPHQLIDSHLQILKKISKFDPEQASHYKSQFESTLELKFARQDFQIIKDRLVSNLIRDTFRNIAVILGLFLTFSFLISRHLVLSFQNLLDKLQAQSSRLEKLNTIESWQKIARVLVHELRAPITPIKLVATDIERKLQTLNSSQFRLYLHEVAKLIQNEILSIEKLMENFTQFAKLPEVNRTPHSLLQTLNHLVFLYSGYNQGQVTLHFKTIDLKKETILLDPEAIKHLFFNLIKNASEANLGNPIEVEIGVRQSDQKTWIQIKNSGNKIPDEIVEKIFDLHVSTKKGMGTPNLGVGLTVARKIAFDHQGDLTLRSNQEDGVIFELELPNL